MATLGNYVSVTLATSDVPASLAFYESLGFQKLSDDTVTDGSINLCLRKGDFKTPTLAYMGSDLPAVRALFSPQKQKRKATPTTSGEFNDPNGLRITINEAPSNVPMPGGGVTSRTPISKLGKFGEFTIPTDNLTQSLVFWAKLGFEALHVAKIPYSYAILSDGLIVIGLHEFNQPYVALAYFAEDMAQRIQALKAEGLDIRDFPADGSFDAAQGDQVENAMFLSDEGQAFYLFKGAV